MDIREALEHLDPLDDSHWTQDGAPRTEVVSDLVGSKVSRQDITNAAPKFSRENFDLSTNEDEPKVEEPPVEEEQSQVQFVEMPEEPLIPFEFSRFLNTVPKEQLPSMIEVLQEQENELAKATTHLQEMLRRVRANRSIARAVAARLFPDVTNQEAIQGYIKSQHELRAAKRAATAAILKGVDVNALDPRAPIDRAFARKTQRGGSRPSR